MEGKKNSKKGLWKNLVLGLVLVAIILPQFLAFPKQAAAYDDIMVKVFPRAGSASEIGTNLPAHIATSGPAYNGFAPDEDHPDEYLVSNNNLKVELDESRLPTANSASFYVTINLGGEHKAATDFPGSSPGWTTNDEIGSWNVVYDTDLKSDVSGGSQGMFLRIGKGVANIQKSYSLVTVTTPPLTPTVSGSPTSLENPQITVALDEVIDFTYTKQRIPLTIGTAGLEPNTQYYAQLVIKADARPETARSNIVAFTTGAEEANGQNNPTLGLTEGEDIVGETDNEAVLLMFADCDADSASTWFQGCMVHLFYYTLYVPSRWILEAASWFLDVSLVFSISSKIYSDPTFITEGWRIVRDVSNIFFIFLLVAIAFQIILDIGSSQAKKLLSSLILIAIVVNFSMFLAKVVIDSSNILARVFYNQIQVNGSTRPALSDPNDTNNIQEKSFSQALADGFNVQKMVSEETVYKLRAERGDSPSYLFLIVLLGLIMNIIAAWSFFITGLLMIGRIVGLWVVMIFAAFAFVSRLAPNVLGRIPRISWKDWSSDLFSLSFLAPIFLFFVYIIIMFVNEKFLEGLFNNIQTFDFTSMMVAIALQFAILISLIKQSRKLAEKLAGEAGGAIVSGMKGVTGAVAGVVTGAAKMVGGAAIGAVAGGAGMLARGTVGRTAAKMSKSEGLRDRMARGGISGFLAKQQLRAANAVAGSSFDARNTKAFTSATAGLGGKGQVGGFTGDVERKKKEEIENARLLQTKKTAGQIKSMPENVEKAKKYAKDVDTYKEKRNADYEAWVAPRKNQPGFNPQQAMKDFMQDYATDPTKNPNGNKRPEPPKYITAESINARRQSERANYLRTGTLSAAAERNFGAAGQAVTGGSRRQGELAAADQLAGNPKDNDKLETLIEHLTKADKQLEQELKILTAALRKKNNIKDANGNKLEGKALEDEVEKMKLKLDLNKKTVDDDLKKWRSAYQAETDPVKKQKIFDNELAAANLAKKRHTEEVNFLKGIFKLEQQERAKRQAYEKNKASLKDAKAKRPGPGPEEKK